MRPIGSSSMPYKTSQSAASSTSSFVSFGSGFAVPTSTPSPGSSRVPSRAESEDAESWTPIISRPASAAAPYSSSSTGSRGSKVFWRDEGLKGLAHPRPQRQMVARLDYPSTSLDDIKSSSDAYRFETVLPASGSVFGPGGIGSDVIPLRSKSLSPSLFGPGAPMISASQVSMLKPGRVAAKKDDKKKHGSFKIWHRNASEELQEAYNAIYGLPLYGSVAFVGKVIAIDEKDKDGLDDMYGLEREEAPPEETVQIIPGTDTCVIKRFAGPALVSSEVVPGIFVEISSAGKDDGDFASILINGEQKCENKRGINLVVLDEEGSYKFAEAFDTHGLPEEADKLAAFVKGLPVGYIVLGAVRDDGAKFLGTVGRSCLLKIGVDIPASDDDTRLRKVIPMLPPDRTKVLLTVCAKANAKKCAKALIQNGWEIHSRASHTLNTPLHDAVYQKNTDVAVVLLDAGADPKLENKWGETPADIARKKFGFDSLEDMIMQHDIHIQSVMRFIGI